MGLYAILIISLVLSAFFSGMEIAFVSSNKLRFEVEKDESSLTSAIITKFYQHPQLFITTMLVGNNIVLVIFSIKMNELLLPYFSFTQNGLILSLLVSLIATLIVLFFGEYIPKIVMRNNPNSWLRVFSPLLYLIYIVLFPISYFCTWLSRMLLHSTTHSLPKTTSEVTFSRADLNYLVNEIKPNDDEEADADETPSGNEIQILQNALDFSNVKIRDCYIPRTEVVALPYEVSTEDLIQTFMETGFSKILIYKGDIDNIVGYIHCTEMFEHRKKWHEHINKTPYVTENMAAQKLMRMFMQQKKSIAVVVDEFGGTAGIVTLEDIFEEIFGEIEDEHDTQEFTAKQLSDNEYIVSGRMEVEDINDRFSLHLPESEAYDTIGGLLLHRLGAFPKVNQIVNIEDYSIQCLKLKNNRIERIRIKCL